ncbi:MAG TPA: FAD-dependent oxidoreductase, partial [bacterium]|nr:FAD-dependent oxidoreductase [bacterium]
MRRRTFLSLLSVTPWLVTARHTSFAVSDEPLNYDVVVYGGTAGGAIAAIAAAQEGLKTALLEPRDH